MAINRIIDINLKIAADDEEQSATRGNLSQLDVHPRYQS